MNHFAREQPSASEQSALRTHLGCGQLEQAQYLATALIDRFPQHSFGWKALGLAHQMRGQLTQALQATRQAVLLQPGDTEARLNLAHMLQAAGLATEAIAQFRAVLGLSADDLGAHASLAQLLTCCGELPDAVSHFRQALALHLRCETKGRALACQPLAREQPDMAEVQALMWKTMALLARSGVHVAPMSGTLLGLVREGALLPWDKDVDLVLPFDEMAHARAALVTHGWSEVINPMRLLNPIAFTHSASAMVLDLCGVRLETGTGMTVGGFWQENLRWEWQRVTEYPPLSLHQLERPEGTVWMHDQPQGWLAALYGDWRTPQPDFDTVVQAHNLRGFSLLTESFALARINGHWQAGNTCKALSLARHCLRQKPDDALIRQVCQHLIDAK